MVGRRRSGVGGVGAVTLVRTFRVGADGGLYPVNTATAWQDGWNTAVCGRGRSHDPPAEGCRCGFYAYADPIYAAEQPPARDVLAVITADGTLEVGTRGARVGHARIVAVWFSNRIPAELAARVAQRYPHVPQYRSRDAMFDDFPLTGRPEFRRPRLGARQRRWLHRGVVALVALVLVAGLLSPDWVVNTSIATGAFLALVAVTAATAVGGIVRRSPPLILLGLWLFAWLVSAQSPISLTLLAVLAGWLVLAWRYAQRIGPVIREPRYAATLRRWRGRWMSG